ncbi:hypothetical protein BD410DRAFT_395423 [Rickenella mellea]|uniref:Uncharacterized protein n=1 Tax=Rickenella mellea TaxID=50990 RepID=A0A4Y7PY86_9AGAM|nr:hypothetical protein BD410DRAFT_395423 [Rickenella mellea]
MCFEELQTSRQQRRICKFTSSIHSIPSSVFLCHMIVAASASFLLLNQPSGVRLCCSCGIPLELC